MTTKTKKILALLGWLSFVIIWPTYNIVQYNIVLAKVVDVLIVCIGTYILLCVFNPGIIKNKEKE